MADVDMTDAPPQAKASKGKEIAEKDKAGDKKRFEVKKVGSQKY